MKADEKIKLPVEMSQEEKKRLIEFALLQGFQSISAEFPIVSEEGTIELPKTFETLDIPEISSDIPEDYVSSTDSAKDIPEYEWRKKTGLEAMFEKGFFLKDENKDQLPDKVDVKFILPKEYDHALLTAACNLAFRIGMETTGFEGPLVADEGYTGNAIVFENAEKCSMRFEESGENKFIYIRGKGTELIEFSNLICEKFPLLPKGQTWSDMCREMTDSFAMKNLDGQFSYMEAFKEELGKKVTAFVSSEIEYKSEKAGSRFPGVTFENYKGMKKVYRKEYDIPWEVDVFREKIAPLYDEIHAGDEVEVFGALSEEQDVRNTLSIEITNKLKEKGATLKESQIICAYKQGFSWIDEIIIPKLAKRDVDKILVQFKPFMPEGQTDWLDENGATPSYTNLDSSNPDKWYDLPIRYLQELYPITDVIEEKTGIEKENIEFVVYEGEREITYIFQAKDKQGNVIMEESYLSANVERPYLDIYPEMGKVHPSTGYIKVLVNGKELLNERVQTDVEAIWDIYQRDVLGDLRDFVEAKLGDDICIKNQPFFSRISLEVTASEPDYRLPSREDLISSLDALHEDMYFVGTDLFKNYGVRKTGEITDAPGLILPVLKKGQGKPSFCVTLYDVMAEQPKLCGDKEVVSLCERTDVETYVKELAYENGEVTASVYVKVPDEKIAEAYVDLFNEGVLESSEAFDYVTTINLLTDTNTYKMKVKPFIEPEKDLDIRDIDLLEHTLIGYDQYMEIVEKLKRVKGISVFKTAVSYAGREVYAIELLSKRKGYISRTKRINLLPSEIINSRHHANEVSSTNSALMLLKTLLTEEKYADLPEKMNLVIVPMENVDGTAIHYELQKDNPYWKFHVARFNAIGKEFFHEHFVEDTIHTEAKGFKKLWYQYLPDLVVDNHGVPSHEWEQQFSGYTSPSFKGFWLPRSLLYGYFWCVTDEVYKGNYAVNKKMEDVIADAIAEHPEMRSLNKEWMEQFEKFAHSFMPKLFPANYYKDMINYWIPFAQSDIHRYPSIRFPWITTVSYTSEVADETAQGDYLNLCARAHVAHDLAIIDLWTKGKSIFKEKRTLTKDYVSISQIRQRPIIV